MGRVPALGEVRLRLGMVNRVRNIQRGGDRDEERSRGNKGNTGDGKFHQECVLWRMSLDPRRAFRALDFPGPDVALAWYLIGMLAKGLLPCA